MNKYNDIYLTLKIQNEKYFRSAKPEEEMTNNTIYWMALKILTFS